MRPPVLIQELWQEHGSVRVRMKDCLETPTLLSTWRRLSPTRTCVLVITAQERTCSDNTGNQDQADYSGSTSARVSTINRIAFQCKRCAPSNLNLALYARILVMWNINQDFLQCHQFMLRLEIRLKANERVVQLNCI